MLARIAGSKRLYVAAEFEVEWEESEYGSPQEAKGNAKQEKCANPDALPPPFPEKEDLIPDFRRS